MFRSCVFATSVVLIVAASSPATAQPSRSYLGPGVVLAQHNYNYLLDFPSVQQDLQLTPDQLLRVAKIKEKHLKSLESLSKLTGEMIKKLRTDKAERVVIQAEVAKDQAVRRVTFENREKELIEALDRKASERLNEIRIRSEGPMAFTRPEIQRQIGLKPDQVDAIAKIVDDGREEMIRTTPDRGELTGADAQAQPDLLEKARHPARQLRASLIKKIAAILDEKQDTIYQQMLGNPFDLATLLPARSRPKESQTQSSP
jgi:hypothetical protein